MSFLSYNDIELKLLKTNSVERTVKLSDDNTEYVYTEWMISITAVYSPAEGATSYASSVDGNPPLYERDHFPEDTDTDIRHWLMQPRRSLLYQEGGMNILSIPSNLENGGAVDANNGPLPQSCSISRIAGARLFYVNYIIKCFVIECPPKTECNSGDTLQDCCALVSSRYSRTEYIDDQYRSTMVLSGVAYFRSDVLAQIARHADFFRGFLIPPQLLGYKRKNIQFTLAHGGTMMEYNCMDVEQFQDLGQLGIPGTAASVGITDMDLRYSCGPALGGTAGSKLQIVGYGALVNVFASAKGMKSANALHMTIFLIAVCVQKLGIIFKKGDGKKGMGVPTGARITEDVFRKEVTVSLDYFVNYDQDNIVKAKVAVPIEGWIGKSPQNLPNIINLPDLGGLNPQPPFSQGTRGTAAYDLAVRRFAEACYCSLEDSDSTGDNPPDDLFIPGESHGKSPSVQGLLPPPTLDQTFNYRSSGQNDRSKDGQGVSSHPAYDATHGTYTDTGVVQLRIASSPPPPAPKDPLLEGANGASGTGLPPSPNDPAWYDRPSCVNIRLFNPVTYVQMDWKGVRTGSPLEIPDPQPIEPLDAEYTLMSRVISPQAVQLGSSGGDLSYWGSGRYVYAKKHPIPNQARIPYPIPPSIAVTDDNFNEWVDVLETKEEDFKTITALHKTTDTGSSPGTG